MLQRRIPMWASALALGLVAVFVAGFFHSSRNPSVEVAAQAPKAVLRMRMPEPAREMALEKVAGADMMARAGGAAFHVPVHLYRRTGEVSSKVESVVKAYKEIDGKMKSFGGEIVEMEITGNDEGRQGRIAVTVSTDRFNDFIDYARGLGKVLSERIAASARPVAGSGRNVPAADDVDPRELSVVTVSLVDEKVAREVHESRGMLASSFTRSASHFLAGIAVMVELFGWLAPYGFVLALVAVPILALRRYRQQRDAQQIR